MLNLNTFKSSLMHSQGALASCIGLLCGWAYLSEVFSSIFSCESPWKLRTALSTVLKLRRRVWESTLKTLHLWKCALFWKKISRSSLTHNPKDLLLLDWNEWWTMNPLSECCNSIRECYTPPISQKFAGSERGITLRSLIKNSRRLPADKLRCRNYVNTH